MAKKRTKKQKQRAVQSRETTLSYSLDDIKTVPPKKLNKKSTEKSNNLSPVLKNRPSSRKKSQNPTNINNSRVIRDLLKTLVVTVLVVCALIAYTIYYK